MWSSNEEWSVTANVYQYSRGVRVVAVEPCESLGLIYYEGLPVVHFGRAVRVSVIAFAGMARGMGQECLKRGAVMARRGHGEGSIYRRKDGRVTAAITLDNHKRKTFYGETRKEVQEKLSAALHEQRGKGR